VVQFVIFAGKNECFDIQGSAAKNTALPYSLKPAEAGFCSVTTK